ncbi:FixH family protein [Litorimonas sp. RW-G-Af-16]|uniref:FixH family protein n=1 Tax=Litorimonas sp. RW-G-Af-16 TaxID=3241168 RepID=UPI00390C6D66
MAQEKEASWELNGGHVLVILLSFFVILISVNGYFIYQAVTSFRGEDVKGSYRQGLEYNQTIEARAEASQLGWEVRANVVDNIAGDQTLILKLTDADGGALTRADVTGTLHHRIDTALDQPLTFEDTGAGRLTALISGPPGQYTLKAQAVRGTDRLSFQHDVRVR